MSARYARRPERPQPDLGSPAWTERLDSVKHWLRSITEGNRECLHVGAIWGPRGSGKTSFLKALGRSVSAELGETLRLPVSDPQAKHDTAMALFTPDLIDDDKNGDHLFTHLLHFIRDHYFPDSKQSIMEKPLKLLTEHRYHDDFKDFENEVATSKDDLWRSLHERLSRRATFSDTLRKELREKIQGAIQTRGEDKCPKWFILPVDDIDLVPHRGPELLTLLHLYLRDLPFIVILAADREQLVEHTTIDIRERHGRPDRSLALQYIAKQIPYEWSVPRPSEGERRDSLFDRDLAETSASASDAAPRYIGRVLEDRFRDTKELLRRGWARTQWAQRDNEEAHPPWGDDPTNALDKLLPPSWRGLHRTYNRLATLVEELENPENPDARARWREQLDVHTDLLIPLLTALIAVDEHIPELALWDALVVDPEALLQNIPRRPPPPIVDFNGRAHEPVDDSGYDERRPSPTLPDPDQGTPAPLDRLKDPFLSGREINYGYNVLTALGDLLEAIRSAPSQAQARTGAPNSITITVIALTCTKYIETSALDELRARHTSLESVFDSSVTIEIDEDELDLRSHVQDKRPTAEEIRAMLAEVDQTRPLARHDGALALYPRAPLSLMAWLGWQARQRLAPVDIIGLWNETFTLYQVDKDDIDHDRVEPYELEPPHEVSLAPSAVSERLDRQALVLVDVRAKADLSSRALPLWRDHVNIVPEYAYRLVSHAGFHLTQDNLSSVISDILWLLNSLKNERGIERFHVALATPAPLAFFIGRELHSFIPIDLYEHTPDVPSYMYVTTLK